MGISAMLADRERRGRVELLQGLKATQEFVSEVSAWATGDLYNASGRPEVLLSLKQNADGSVMGWAQGADGRFIGQARWTGATTWGSRVVSSASALAGQVMLVEISQKLERIEAKVDRIKQALDDDRRQALKAAIDHAETAQSRDLLVTGVVPLRTAIAQEIQALVRQIDRTPLPSARHTVRAVWDTSRETRRELTLAQQSFLAIVAGISALVRLYLGLGEDRAAWATANELLTELSRAGLRDAWWKARQILPANSDDIPEEFWNRAIAQLGEAVASSLAFLDGRIPELSIKLRSADFDTGE
jgi:hypothetical protein